MRRLLAAVAAAFDEFTADLRIGITLREAAAVDAFNIELRRVTLSEEDREGIRRGAILLAQYGVTNDDIERLCRLLAQPLEEDQ